MQTMQILSKIEDYNVVGGHRSKTPWGPVDTVSESKYQERKKHQVSRFFKTIMDKISGSNEVYVFGPAKMKDKLKVAILESHVFRNCKVASAQADSMTDPQKIAQARQYFFGAKNKV